MHIVLKDKLANYINEFTANKKSWDYTGISSCRRLSWIG